jgi:hypothetical protein
MATKTRHKPERLEKPRCPILVVDMQLADKERIKGILDGLGVDGSAADVKTLQRVFSPLPDDDAILVERIVGVLALDWDRLSESVDEVLRKLVNEFKAVPRRKGFDHERKRIYRRMVIATRGLEEHPEWYNAWPCACDLCTSYS